jgi:hypothetical protein
MSFGGTYDTATTSRSNRADFERFLARVQQRRGIDPFSARKLVLDLSIVAHGGRRCFMNDYAPGVHTETLAALVRDAVDVYGRIAHGMIVVTFRSVDFVVHLGHWHRGVRGVLEVMGAATPLESRWLAATEAKLAVMDDVCDKAMKPVNEERCAVIDLDSIIEQPKYVREATMSGPTWAGLLLAYPCVYCFLSGEMDEASKVLSSVTLEHFSIECVHSSIPEFAERTTICAFTVPIKHGLEPAMLSEFEKVVVEWEQCIRKVLNCWGFTMTCVKSIKDANSMKVVF